MTTTAARYRPKAGSPYITAENLAPGEYMQAFQSGISARTAKMIIPEIVTKSLFICLSTNSPPSVGEQVI